MVGGILLPVSIKFLFVMTKLQGSFVSGLMLAVHLALAQTSPFASPGLAIGAYHYNFYGDYLEKTYLFRGDTVLCSTPLLVFETPKGYVLYLRTEAGKVFARYNNDPCTDALLLFNFDLNVGQGFPGSSASPPMVVTQTGQVTLLNGENRRYLKLMEPQSGSTVEWVEGIGDLGAGLVRTWYDFEGSDGFVCARDASGDLWLDPSATGNVCDSITCPLPKPGFTVANADGLTVDFYNLTRDADSWLWEFGDGATSTELNPQHTYAVPGCYDVCLTATSPCLTQTRRYCHTQAADLERHWKTLPFPAPPDQGSLLGVSFPHPDTGWVVSSLHIWKTTDGGQTWEDQPFPADPPNVTRRLQNIRMTNTQMGIVTAGNYVQGPGTSPLESSILVTYDGGASWLDRDQGIHTFHYDGMIRPDGSGMATHSYSQIRFTTDFGQTWTYQPTLPYLHLSNILYWEGDVIIANGHRGLGPNFVTAIARSYDNGATWEKTELPAQQVNTRKSTFRSPTEGWLPGNTGTLLHTQDAGLNWTAYDYGEDRQIKSIDFADTQNGWAVGDQGIILHTTNGGQSWLRENCGYEENFIDLSAPSPDVAYVVTNQGQVLKYCEGSCMSVIKSRQSADRKAVLLVSPNPAASSVQVTIPTAGRLLLINALGQVGLDMTVEAGDQTIPILGLPAGLWQLRLTAPNGAVQTGKVVIER